jgi:malate dehydrogenase (oxaloacetate-decarboxylating)
MKIPEIYLVETIHKPGSLASVLQVIADAGLVIEHLQSLRREQGRSLWEITVEIDEQATPSFYAGIDALPNARIVGTSDRVFNRHKGSKIHMRPSLQITTKQILRDIYTPGVAGLSGIRDDPAKRRSMPICRIP